MLCSYHNLKKDKTLLFLEYKLHKGKFGSPLYCQHLQPKYLYNKWMNDYLLYDVDDLSTTLRKLEVVKI